MGIAVEDAQDLDAVPAERGRGRRDHRVGGRRGPPANKIATRRMAPAPDCESEGGADEGDMNDFLIAILILISILRTRFSLAIVSWLMFARQSQID